ncbi:MAG: HDIG domain-containing metalloprotein [Natronincolaceae bacterium]|jgi:putative nucleotidyltransferase with HDIG domain|nr:HDIG domain-containing protein [Bacillota bacterium]NLK90211.1 HDIG domain-containing protein [Clostridiales bacterium]
MGGSTEKLFQRKSIKNFLIALLFFASLFFILSTSLNPEKFDLEIGQKAPEDIRAPKDIEDKISTESARQKAASMVEPIYKLNLGVHVEVKKDIENFFLLVYRLRSDEELTEAEKITQLTSRNDLNIGTVNTRVAITAPLEKLKYLESYINEIATQNMNAGINVEDLQKQKSSIKEYITNLDEFDNELKDLAISIIYATIRPNKFLDEEATGGEIELAKENVDKVIIRKGENIIREGEVITGDRLELLRELGILTEESRFDFVLYTGVAAVVLVIELLIIAYILAFNRKLLAQPKRLLMVHIIFIFTLIISRAVQGISIYLIPIAASSMLLSILLESRLALLINLCLTILVSIITGNNIIFIAMALVGGTVGAFSVINTQQRANIFVAGIVISIINMITIVGIGFINSSEVMETLTSGFYGLLNGLFCSVLTVGSLPAWESVFNIVTPLKLLELSNPNQPLLKKLLIEAPGTYHHSIIVGNLSESAADALGVNSLLARAGAFYHDIGKTKRPYFFKENQLTCDNPHDKLDPYLSSTIIMDHIKDGVELAKKYKLPVEIRDFIEQHHGTTLVAYFFHEAKTERDGSNIDEKDFRYMGPKPQTKETAIVMLADSVEAAVRSLSSPTREKVEELIEKIIQNRLEDGQLDESNITLKELGKIKKSFLKVILSIFHERIEYPDSDIQKENGDKVNGIVG